MGTKTLIITQLFFCKELSINLKEMSNLGAVKTGKHGSDTDTFVG